MISATILTVASFGAVAMAESCSIALTFPPKTVQQGTEYDLPYKAPNMGAPITIQPLSGCPNNCVNLGAPITVTGGVFKFTPTQDRFMPTSDATYGFNVTQEDVFNYSNNFGVAAGQPNSGPATSTISVPANLPACSSTSSSSLSPTSMTSSSRGNSTITYSTSSLAPTVPVATSSKTLAPPMSFPNTYSATLTTPAIVVTSSKGTPVSFTTYGTLVSQIVDGQPQGPTQAVTYSASAGPAATTPGVVYQPPTGSSPSTGVSTPGAAPPRYTGGAGVHNVGCGVMGAAAGLAGLFAMLQ